MQFSRLSPAGAPLRLVLDTNVVLDCFVFRDPATRDLVEAIETHRVEALVHAVTLDEFERVLAYPQCRLDPAEQRTVLDRYVRLATVVSMPLGFSREDPQLPPDFPRCRDRDDEIFIALAYHTQADALVTKDKVVLKLRRKARKFGVAIVAPRELQVVD